MEQTVTTIMSRKQHFWGVGQFGAYGFFVFLLVFPLWMRFRGGLTKKPEQETTAQKAEANE